MISYLISLIGSNDFLIDCWLWFISGYGVICWS